MTFSYCEEIQEMKGSRSELQDIEAHSEKLEG